MQITRIFTNNNGDSAFEDMSIPFEHNKVEKLISLPAPSLMQLAETDAGHDYGWHNPPHRQWVITLQGEVEVKLRNGSCRTFGSGSMLLAEDTEGTGHNTKVISSGSWRCIYLPFKGDVNALIKS